MPSFDAGKGRLHSFNYGLYWPLWDLVCGTRYKDLSAANHVNLAAELNERTEKKLT